MPRDLITNPVENINSLQSQMKALQEHQADVGNNIQALTDDPVKNEDILRFLRFLKSFLLTTKSRTFQSHTNDDLSIRFFGMGKHTSDYLDSPLSQLPNYLFKLIAALDDLENSPQRVQFPPENKISVQEIY